MQTPLARSNLPGLPSVSYRAGTWGNFKESMLARLSSSDYPALSRLKTREDDDFTIAFLDASAMVLDILAFYQERLANESYLRTAGELRSLIELSRLIGYQPAPGVAASTYVAFTLQAAPGQAPNPSAGAITIPQRTQLQSVPGQGQTPQTFETSADILAKSDWNALPVQSGQPWAPRMGDKSVYLDGTATQLQPGDLILIVGDERAGSPDNNNWDVRVVVTVQPDTLKNRTYVAWAEGLGDPHAHVAPSTSHPKFFALRQRAALFGYNAINPQLFTGEIKTNLSTLLSGNDWNFAIPDLSDSQLVDLDAVYPKVVSDGWIVLIEPDQRTSRSPAGLISLYEVKSVTAITRSGFALSSKISRLAVDSKTNLSSYYASTRSASAFAQSDELAATEQPLDHPLYGTRLDLKDLRPDLVGAQVVAVTGKRQKIAVKTGNPVLSFDPADGSDAMTLNPGDLLTLTDPSPLPRDTDGFIPDWSSATGVQTLNVEDSSGRPGTVTAALRHFTLAAATSNDPNVSECALVISVSNVIAPFPHTVILLKSSLVNCHNRAATTVNANVGLATHGQSVREVMGSGSAFTPNQVFTLKQSPLTFVQASTPTGRQSTLQVQANGVSWTELPTLFKQGPSQRVFNTLNQPDGTARVQFGDGVEGAMLPTGQNNVRASYRIGLGSAGNVDAGSLTTLLDRPLGVSGVTNPEFATGGQDAQSISDVRSNAPLTVLTLGRAVSIADYQSFAATFAGIAKAHALWIPSGPGRGVFLTVAAVGGVALNDGDPILSKLMASLHNFGNPLIPITIRSFHETSFGLSADLRYDSAFSQPAVQSQVLEVLSRAFRFEERTFGQCVSVDELATVIQNVPGVVAVNVKEIHTLATSAGGDIASRGKAFALDRMRRWQGRRILPPRRLSGSPKRICPLVPVADPTSVPQPAEILVLDPDPSSVLLGVMP